MSELYKVYVKTDEQGRIIAINSNAFLEDLAGWIEIDSGTSDKHAHAQANYIGSLLDDRGLFKYRLVDGKPVERTEAELNDDEKRLPRIPSFRERIAALEKIIDIIKSLLGVKE